MKVLKKLSLLSGVAALVVAALYVEASAAQQSGTAQGQSQPRRTTSQAANQRRSYRSYSYEPSRGGDVAPRASSPTWSRADSKVKARYGYYPY
jgi:hypothetical protein